MVWEWIDGFDSFVGFLGFVDWWLRWDLSAHSRVSSVLDPH